MEFLKIICGQIETELSGIIWYDTIYLTAIGLTPGGSSTVHIYTQTIHEQHNGHKTIFMYGIYSY